MSFTSLSEALTWVERYWDQRLPPTRLHDPTQTEGELGGLPYSPGFASYLDALPSHTTQEVRTVTCGHPTLRKGQDPNECHECAGTCVKSATRLVYRWPMWRAWTRLQNALPSPRQSHPCRLILALAAHGWQAHKAAASLEMPWDYAEAAFLRALRQLHGRYEEGPVDTRRTKTHGPGGSWTLLSESQQNAIMAGESAA